jgi:aryl-alcohol dehydrogenase-like predicted oxidoreductase
LIFNCFRHRPAELFFEQAKKRKLGILARVPVASGMLSGRLARDSQFEMADHRNFNRNGERFDRGETFSGVDFNTALEQPRRSAGWFLTVSPWPSLPSDGS